MKDLKFTILLMVACSGLIQGQQFQRENPNQWKKTKLVFKDKGTRNWKKKWMLDGKKSKVINSKKGMELVAGPKFGDNASHTVLWTKKSFKKNILIEYEYTRTDTVTRGVNILYFHARGKGNDGFPSDISIWNDKRTVPRMDLYFLNMHAYHISYAAFSAEEYSGDNDYIRLRRYDPAKEGIEGTNVKNEYVRTGLFRPFVTYIIRVLKYGNKIEMHIKNKKDKKDNLICRWDVSVFPDCNFGKIGFRHMFTRSARYKNIKVWEVL